MSSGGKQVVFNTRERLVSNDHNRTQRFADWEMSEILRRLFGNRIGTAPFNFGGAVQETGGYVDTDDVDTAGIGVPLKGDVLEGLVVLPQQGSLNLHVSPGCVLLDDPDGQTGSSQATPANPDDSRGKLVADPGLLVSGVLTIAAGSGGGTRIDVIECRRSQVVTENDNRDVFDPGTNSFAPQSVPKAMASQLEYRVRQGTPGAGLPANVQGWLPLAVASVPTSAATVDDITFWDVRPLVKDRVSWDQQSLIPFIEPNSSLTVKTTPTVPLTFQDQFGYITSQLGMYRAGGIVDFDLMDTAFWEPGFTPAANLIYYLYAVFPGNLPRWVRYAASPNPRIPNGPLGVLTVAQTVPNPSGIGVTNVVAPASSTGLGGVGVAAILSAGYCITDGTSVKPRATSLAGDVYRPTAYRVVAPTSGFNNWTLVPGGQFPIGAKTVFLKFSFGLTGGAADTVFNYSQNVDVLDPSNTNLIYPVEAGTGTDFTNGSGDAGLGFVVEVPVARFQLGAGYASDNLKITVPLSGSIGTLNSGSLSIVGWRF